MSSEASKDIILVKGKNKITINDDYTLPFYDYQLNVENAEKKFFQKIHF